MSELTTGRLARYWPFAAVGLIGPILTILFARWMPLHYAAAASAFVAFFIAISLFERTSRRPMHSFAKLAVALVAALTTGFMTFLFPWR